MGKGSGRRPTDEDKYKANWETIFGKKPDEVEQQELFNKENEDELRKEATESNL